jgi:hypothetical protein
MAPLYFRVFTQNKKKKTSGSVTYTDVLLAFTSRSGSSSEETFRHAPFVDTPWNVLKSLFSPHRKPATEPQSQKLHGPLPMVLTFFPQNAYN